MNTDALIKNAIDLGFKVDDALDMLLEDPKTLDDLWEITELKQAIEKNKEKLRKINMILRWAVYLDGKFTTALMLPNLSFSLIIENLRNRFPPDRYTIEIIRDTQAIMINTIDSP